MSIVRCRFAGAHADRHCRRRLRRSRRQRFGSPGSAAHRRGGRRQDDGNQYLRGLLERRGELVEEASIGAANGGEEYLLGGVTSIAAGGGRIYLVDFQAVKVRAYSWDGTHALDIGSLGAGPGEFQRPFDIGFRDDGRIIVRDQAQRRVHVFSPEGALIDDWPTERGNRATVATDPCWRQPLVADVFDRQGGFLGSVPMPDGIRYHVRPYIDGDTIVALMEDAEGTRFVRRYRLRVPD